MLIIFDVDGTLIESDPADWNAYKGALRTVLGFTPPSGFCRALGDVTAHSVAAASMRAAGLAESEGLMAQVRSEHLRGLKEAHAADPRAFRARPGAGAALEALRAWPRAAVAIATGDWSPTSRFKLAAAGVEVGPLPMATCSDRPRRAEIIALAAERAGRPLREAVYVGDGPWDLHACRELGIPFIATGANCGELSRLGAVHLHPEYDSAALPALVQIALGGAAG